MSEPVSRYAGALPEMERWPYSNEPPNKQWRVFVLATEHEAAITAAQQRIAALERDLKNERARGIHTCYDQCPRPLCVAHREIANLRNRLNLSEKLHGRLPVDAVQPDQKDVS